MGGALPVPAAPIASRVEPVMANTIAEIDAVDRANDTTEIATAEARVQ